jgi:hypothetical protein
LIYDDKIKANLLNKYCCSISFVDDTNHVPPDIPSRTDALLSNIYITEHDVKDILQTLKIGKACGDDGITHQMLRSTSETICIPLCQKLLKCFDLNRKSRVITTQSDSFKNG